MGSEKSKQKKQTRKGTKRTRAKQAISERNTRMKNRKSIDCTGLSCPQPVLMTRDALDEAADTPLEVLVDNEASRNNVQRFAESRGCRVEVSTRGDRYALLITPGTERPDQDAPQAEEYTCSVSGAGVVYVFPAETMGRGDRELGKILMRAFVKTIRELDPKPTRLLFYNSGVKLTSTDSDLIAPFRELEEQGVDILSCGTCLDFFHLKEELRVGRVTNMFEIMESMATATRVVSPL